MNVTIDEGIKFSNRAAWSTSTIFGKIANSDSLESFGPSLSNETLHAEAATNQAKETNSPKDHKVAASYHGIAASMHNNAAKMTGNAFDQADHYAKQAYHESLENFHKYHARLGK